MTVIFHNPRCSKSRQTLALLEEQGETPQIVDYLNTPPSPEELKTILGMLKLSARDILRKTETEYQTLNLNNTDLSEDELIAIMCQHPRLIERPIVIKDNNARIGRPPESVLDIL